MSKEPQTEYLLVDTSDPSPPAPEELEEEHQTRQALDQAGITQVPWQMVGNSTKDELDFMSTVSQFAYHWSDKQAFDQYLREEGNPTEEELRAQGYDIKYVVDEESAMQCVVITKGDDIHIGFRGTLVNRKHLAKDLNATLVTAGFIQEGRLHGGFYHGARSLIPKLSTVLDEHAKKQGKSLHDYNFNITGHSMGGAIGKITALYMNKEWKIAAERMRVATFGDPRTFDVKAAAIYDAALGKNTVRISEYGQDVIPKVPTGNMGFKHVGELIKIKKPEGYGAHVMNGYQKGLREITDKEFVDARAVTRLYRLSQAIRLIIDYIPEKVRYAVKHIKKNWLGIKHWHETLEKPESLAPPPPAAKQFVSTSTQTESSGPIIPPPPTVRNLGGTTLDTPRQQENLDPPTAPSTPRGTFRSPKRSYTGLDS
jgi:hypothetical protein